MNRSKINWLLNADGTPGYTWSPTSGCSPISSGCLSCWAKAYHVRYRRGDFSVKLHPEKLDEPLRLRRPSTIGVCLMGDVAHSEVPVGFFAQIWATMALSPQHTYLLLTKRPENLRSMLTANGFYDLVLLAGNMVRTRNYRRRLSGVGMSNPAIRPPPNVWLGVSVEDRKTKSRIDILRDTPAAHRWISLEPQIEDVGTLDLRGIPLVVQGCESGPRRRPFDVAWARSVRDQCKAAGVTYALKQMPIGGRIMEKPGLDDDPEWNLPWVTP